MADYKEQTVSGTQWQRAWRIEGSNELGKPRGLTYQEETAILLGTQPVTSRNGQFLYCPYDPAAGVGDTFPLINPLDGSTIGTMTEQQLYVALSSHYLFKAQQRDAAQAEMMANITKAAQ